MEYRIAKPSGGAVRLNETLKGRLVREASGVFFGTRCVGPRVRAPDFSLNVRTTLNARTILVARTVSAPRHLAAASPNGCPIDPNDSASARPAPRAAPPAAPGRHRAPARPGFGRGSPQPAGFGGARRRRCGAAAPPPREPEGPRGPEVGVVGRAAPASKASQVHRRQGTPKNRGPGAIYSRRAPGRQEVDWTRVHCTCSRSITRR